jgi:CubicO group peptidase (beta-lactamase class C family)
MWHGRGAARLPVVIVRTLLSCGVVALVASLAPPAPVPVDVAVDGPAVDALVEEFRDATGLPGAQVAITRGDEVVHTGGYGYTAAGAPVTAHTPMAVASVSKSFTALAVMQLVEAGRVRLDEPVRTFLPEFTMADPRAAGITVRQLLDQTSGMSDSTFPAFSRRQPASLEELVAGMRDAHLAAAPGSRFEYHNPNYQVAARVVEVVSGQAFGDYVQQHVLGPLGMVDSRTIDTAADLPPSAHGHLVVLGAPVAVPEPRAFGNGSGGVLSSAHDMARWLIAQNNGGRGPDGTSIVSAASVNAMHTPSATSGSYALGWSVGTTATGAPLVEHTGDLFTSTAYQALLPGPGYGIAVMANSGLAHGHAAALGAELIALLEGTSVPSPPSPPVVVDAVLLLLAAGSALFAVRGVRRARSWAARRALRVPVLVRLFPLVVPLLLTAVIHRIVGVLYRGRDVAWVQVPYLFPTFMFLLLTVALGCTAVLVVRLAGLLRGARP